jgi:hypothetical protein
MCHWGFWRMTVYTLEKSLQHGQTTSLMSDFDDANFSVIVAKYISPYGSHMNVQYRCDSTAT